MQGGHNTERLTFAQIKALEGPERKAVLERLGWGIEPGRSQTQQAYVPVPAVSPTRSTITSNQARGIGATLERTGSRMFSCVVPTVEQNLCRREFGSCPYDQSEVAPSDILEHITLHFDEEQWRASEKLALQLQMMTRAKEDPRGHLKANTIHLKQRRQPLSIRGRDASARTFKKVLALEDSGSYFVQGIKGYNLKQRIAAKFKLLEKALQPDQPIQDDSRCSSSSDSLSNDLPGDMTVWREICRLREVPAEITSTVDRPIKHLLTETCEIRVKRAFILSFEEKMKVDGMKAGGMVAKHDAKASLSLPPPLTHAVLNEALTQLPAGAHTLIESMLQCWRTNTLSAEDLLDTVKSFSGSSAALQKIFVTASGEPAIPAASQEQMRELSRLMCM